MVRTLNNQAQRIAELEEQLRKWQTEYARAYVNRQNDLIAENVDLKEQLKNAIVPKFKVGQEVWVVFHHQVLTLLFIILSMIAKLVNGYMV